MGLTLYISETAQDSDEIAITRCRPNGT